ncbi:hypothetical protein [Shimazuella kribbensis]|uniref:hypothetical protein n=1 Tax=Shimazuella kribbensis TaxID=139808 RepID=UPI0003F54C90|nr:hypothetical protein [Shimazuella kribbensis]
MNMEKGVENIDLPCLYKQIRNTPKYKEFFSWPLDFEIENVYLYQNDSDFITMEKTIIIAKDGTGGLFALYGDGPVDDLPILYISSEGQAGFIASNFQECIILLVMCPFWQDLLKFSGRAQLEEMKRSYPICERYFLEDYVEYNSVLCDRIISDLALDIPVDIVQKLYESAKREVKILSLDDEPFDSLFLDYVL